MNMNARDTKVETLISGLSNIQMMIHYVPVFTKGIVTLFKVPSAVGLLYLVTSDGTLVISVIHVY